MSEYTELADNFLKSHSLEFRAVLVGNDCPMYCEDALADRDMDKVNVFPRETHIHGKHYRCTISGTGRGHVSFDFWNSYADEEYNALGQQAYRHRETIIKYSLGKPKQLPTAYDLLACIEKDDVGTFEDFCSNFGYDTDLRRAEGVYRAVQAESKKVQKFFTEGELAEIKEIS